MEKGSQMKKSTEGSGSFLRSLKAVFGALTGAAIECAWVAPLLMGIGTTAYLLVPAWFSRADNFRIVTFGTLTGLGAWIFLVLLLSFVVARPGSDTASWDLASRRRDDLQRRLKAYKAGNKSVAEARVDVARLMDPDFTRPGQRWATHMGYIAMWEGIHHAEEALVPVLSTTGLWETVQKALLQLDGATRDLSTRLGDVLDGVAGFLATRAARGKAKAPRQADKNCGSVKISSEDDARGRLREVISALNSFRDQQWSGLVRLRNQTLTALSMTGLSAFGLLVLAILCNVDSKMITAGITFFLVAAVVGFLSRLMTLSSAGSAVDDYGLQSARMLLVPVVSGLAGLGGVLLTTILFNQSLTSLLELAESTSPLPILSMVFDLSKSSVGIIVAILFGYAPTLFQARLDALVESYKTAITSTESAQRADSAAPGRHGKA